MKAFEYVRPNTLAEAVAILDARGSDARLLAGGTDLIVRLRLGHIRPATVIDVKRVADLSSAIEVTPERIRVGARVVMKDLIDHPDVAERFPALVEAAQVVGSIQIRHRATLAGNLCNASPAADTAPALLVYGAVVNIVGSAGERSVPTADFFVGPGKTVLLRGELVASIDLPTPTEPAGAAFGRMTRRRGVDLATVNLCVLVTASGAARFAYGAVGPKPFVVADDSGVFGLKADDETARAAALTRLLAHATPRSDVRGSREYRSAMLAVMSRRSWATAVARLASQSKGER